MSFHRRVRGTKWMDLAMFFSSLLYPVKGLAGQKEGNERILDVGCGPYKVRGATGIDHVSAPGVEVVHDLDNFPWPFGEASFDRAVCRHSLEHVGNVVRTIDELHRILRPGGSLEILAPHFSSDNAFSDVTHRWFFGYRSMDDFCANRSAKYRLGKANFELEEVRISFLQAAVFANEREEPHSFHGSKLNPFKLVGIESLVNWFPRSYEHFGAFIFRANEVYYRLHALK